ncbi:hypothetical protein Pelo_957 [Pelomyxa schiedti]|nr:hypothetical protein Pelo_957 [Pelomyxa schiedti]
MGGGVVDPDCGILRAEVASLREENRVLRSLLSEFVAKISLVTTDFGQLARLNCAARDVLLSPVSNNSISSTSNGGNNSNIIVSNGSSSSSIAAATKTGAATAIPPQAGAATAPANDSPSAAIDALACPAADSAESAGCHCKFWGTGRRSRCILCKFFYAALADSPATTTNTIAAAITTEAVVISAFTAWNINTTSAAAAFDVPLASPNSSIPTTATQYEFVAHAAARIIRPASAPPSGRVGGTLPTAPPSKDTITG